MAATQAEKQQQNDVNSEKEQHLNVRNTLLQNGTEKSGARASSGSVVVVTKGKSAGNKNSNSGGIVDMSQYRQDGGSGAGATAATGAGANAAGGNNGESEQEMGPAGGGDMYAASGPTAVAEGPPVGDGHGGYGFPFGGARDSTMHNSGGDSSSNLHSFGARHGFGAPKQQQQSQQQQQQSPFPQQQRFVSGQTISQPTGPTPTLNQLLQSANPMQRYQNSYGHTEQPYMQGWPQKTTPYSTASVPGNVPAQSYRTQTTVSTPTYNNFYSLLLHRSIN